MNAFSDMRLLNGCLTVIIVIVMIKRSRLAILQANDVENWAIILGEEIQEIFNDATKQSDIIEMYKSHAQAEIFDPRVELKRAKHNIESYLKRRAKAAWDAKISLESRILSNLSENQLNDPLSMNFIQFMSAKTGSDSARVYAHGHTGQITEVNSTHVLNLTANANLYGIGTSSAMSAVHIPTPVYDRNVDVLLKIDWSNIDQLYRANREETRDLAFQMFCSESGFMRYYPATLWTWDNKGDGLDLFDCRSTPWYINGATLSKNVVIMVDMSGSMLGQRFEIAKQTVEAILDTLSDNDFFNIMPVLLIFSIFLFRMRKVLGIFYKCLLVEFKFSKNVRFLDECAEKAGLVQATVRNKKVKIFLISYILTNSARQPESLF
ncbi:unnamed protein product [Dracunculus medinensis]|uniref:VWA_N domain-containing protein n=1 Tax=Dracunculus medinensis TaxID=318479 RepID=A0A158Q695_DRAME|nr:unnamed protein product [Dracunculus medinensis]